MVKTRSSTKKAEEAVRPTRPTGPTYRSSSDLLIDRSRWPVDDSPHPMDNIHLSSPDKNLCWLNTAVRGLVCALGNQFDFTSNLTHCLFVKISLNLFILALAPCVPYRDLIEMAEAHADFATHRGLQILYQFCKIIEKFLAEETDSRLEECDELVQDLPFIVDDKYKQHQVISEATGDTTVIRADPNEFLSLFFQGLNCIDNSIVSSFTQRYYN
jgi:hypothetical protein